MLYMIFHTLLARNKLLFVTIHLYMIANRTMNLPLSTSTYISAAIYDSKE